MLVIDRVELQPVDHVAQRWHLDDRFAVVLEEQPYAVEHAVEIGHVGEDVVGVDNVGAAAMGGQPRREIAAEELFDSLDAALFASDAGDVAGRLDAENLDPAGTIMLQKIAIIAGDLDHKRVGSQVAPAHHTLHQRARMRHKCVGDRRQINIVVKQQFRRDRNRELDKAAGWAAENLKRITRLRPRASLRPHQRIGKWRHSKCEDRCQRSRAARAAVRRLRKRRGQCLPFNAIALSRHRSRADRQVRLQYAQRWYG